jgi:hypothetical protein
MDGFLTGSNLIIFVFLLILGLIAGAATFLDRSAFQPMRIIARPRDPEDGSSAEPDS